MRRLLIVLVLVVAGVVGLAFYQGWFPLSTGGPDGKANVPVTADREKIEQDKEEAKQKVQTFGQKLTDRLMSP
jgi:hypothetical protein